MKILHVISDPLAESQSVNKRVAKHFLQQMQRLEPKVSITEIDLYQQPPPFLDEAQINCIWQPLSDPTYSPSKQEQQSIVYLEQQTEQFNQVDLVIISAPVWNYYLPSILKAWVDQIICPGRVFEFGESGNRPLHHVVAMINVISAGGLLSKSGVDKPIFQLLSGPFEFIGIGQFHNVLIEGQEPALYPDHQEREEAAILEVERIATEIMEHY